jgi:hypothetical protein
MAAQLVHLTIQGVQHPGKDKESITLLVNSDLNLADFLIYDTTYSTEGNVSNHERHMFRFPDCAVKAGDRVLLITKKKGNAKQSLEDGSTAYGFRWGLKQTVWNQGADNATLVRISHEMRKSVE